MLRRCADLSRDAAGPPDQLPFSEAAPVAVLQASVSDMPALCDRLSSHELVQRDGLCIHVSALLGEIIHSLRFVTDSNDRCLVALRIMGQTCGRSSAAIQLPYCAGLMTATTAGLGP